MPVRQHDWSPPVIATMCGLARRGDLFLTLAPSRELKPRLNQISAGTWLSIACKDERRTYIRIKRWEILRQQDANKKRRKIATSSA